MIPPGLAGLAESPDAHTILPPGFHRVLNERFALLLGPPAHFTSVQRLRLDPEAVEAAVEEVRGIVREHGHTNATWWIGGSTEPPDLAARLEALGFQLPADRVSDLVALATASPPEPGPPDVEARAVETLAEFTTANEIRWDAFGVPEERRAAERRELERLFREVHGSGISPTLLAWVDGRPAASAIGVYAPEGCLLVGGGTAAWARGRGAYRALSRSGGGEAATCARWAAPSSLRRLVRARWDEAGRRGTPGLAVEAAPTSEPILRRLGFQEVTRLRRLEEPAA